MERVACDFCGSTNAEEVTRQTDILHKTTAEVFFVVRCRDCGLQFVNPRPSREEIGRYYSDEYSFHAAPGRIRRAISSALSWLANSPLHPLFNIVPGLNRKLSMYVLPRIEDPVRVYSKGGKILDIGCGSGLSAHFWGEQGALLAYSKIADVYGVEVSGRARDALFAEGIPAYKSLADVPADLRFETIRMNWSLEHVHSPSECFDFITSRLTKGGKAIIAVPNYDGLLYAMARDCVEVPIHLYHFRVQDIVRYAEKFGLAVIEQKTFSYPQMFFFAAGILPRLSKGFAPAMAISEARLFQKILGRFDEQGMGNDMTVVLEKK